MSASEEWERTGLQTKSGAEKTFVRLKASYPHVEMYIDEDEMGENEFFSCTKRYTLIQ